MRREVFMTLRGAEVQLDVGIEEPDESVGIFGYGAADVCVRDMDGRALDWILTDDEQQEVTDKLQDLMNDGEDPDPFETGG